MSGLRSAFRADGTYLCTFRSLNPYQRCREEVGLVPFNIPVPDRSLSRREPWEVFVYYSFPHPTFAKIPQSLAAQRKWPCKFYATHYTQALQASLVAGRHQVLTRPMDFRQVVQFACCVHHGGFGKATAVAMAGRPQCITPFPLEHALTEHVLAGPQAAVMFLPVDIDQWQSGRAAIQDLHRCPCAWMPTSCVTHELGTGRSIGSPPDLEPARGRPLIADRARNSKAAVISWGLHPAFPIAFVVARGAS
jgi:hypothetical protein